MARELVNLSNQNEELQEIKEGHEQLQQEHKELNQRYSAILQMYGEKEEQVQELRLDLQDVKEMYKTQVRQDSNLTFAL
ncbi:TATA-element modulatory factor [Plakobranchus ocellatus]|uniref:TATA-element modulatory factor n=1 Tax=Plakobranchus ocellatus TaxID=259542 RepID=A0AAV3Z8Q1_9GAST|nr:TATA-element modulatory factor [Plakobranchus ocellatus]